MNWNKLSMANKAALMRIYIQNGINDLDAMREHYNTFRDGGDEDNKIYHARPLQEVKITAEATPRNKKIAKYLPHLNDYQKAQLKRYYTNPDGTYTDRGLQYIEDMGSRNMTGKSNYMRDTDKLAVIPNMAVGAIGAVPAAAGVIGGATAGALASPIAAAKMLAGFAGFEAVNQTVKDNTDYNSWGDMLNQEIYRENATPANEFLLEFSNPGGALGGIGNVVEKMPQIFNKGVRGTKALGSLAKEDAKSYIRNFRKRSEDDRTLYERLLGVPYKSYYNPYTETAYLEDRVTGMQDELHKLNKMRQGVVEGYDWVYEMPEYENLSFPTGGMFKENPLTLHLPEGDVTGTTLVFDNSVVAPLDLQKMKQSRSHWWVTGLNTDNIATAKSSGRVYPIKNSENLNEALKKHIETIEAKAGAPVVGSAKLISEGFLGGEPGDIELLTSPYGRDYVEKALGFIKSNETSGGTGVTGYSPMILKGREANNLDINVLDQTGTLIHQFERTRNPEKMVEAYTNRALDLAKKIEEKKPVKVTPSHKLMVPKNKTVTFTTEEEYLNELQNHPEKFYTADEYVEELIQNPKDVFQNIVDNNMGSSKDKHIIRQTILMNSNEPKIVESVNTAIDHMYAQIRGFERVSGKLNHNWNDVEANKKILELIKKDHVDKVFDVDAVAKNPQQMKNFVDRWYMRKTEHTRSANYEPERGASFKDLMSPQSQYGNGSASGGGGNTTSGSTFGGFTRDFTSYEYIEPRIVQQDNLTFKNLFDYFKHEETVWNDTNAVKKAIDDALKEMNLEGKIKINNYSSRFTDDVRDAVSNGDISSNIHDDFIERVADNLGVDGIRGTSQYGTHAGLHAGRYYGRMVKRNNPRVHTEYKNIDGGSHNRPEFPNEFGGDAELISDIELKDIEENLEKYLTQHPEYPQENLQKYKLTNQERQKVYAETASQYAKEFQDTDVYGKMFPIEDIENYIEALKNAGIIKSESELEQLPYLWFKDSPDSKGRILVPRQFMELFDEKVGKIVDEKVGLTKLANKQEQLNNFIKSRQQKLNELNDKIEEAQNAANKRERFIRTAGGIAAVPAVTGGVTGMAYMLEHGIGEPVYEKHLWKNIPNSLKEVITKEDIRKLCRADITYDALYNKISKEKLSKLNADDKYNLEQLQYVYGINRNKKEKRTRQKE